MAISQGSSYRIQLSSGDSIIHRKNQPTNPLPLRSRSQRARRNLNRRITPSSGRQAFDVALKMKTSALLLPLFIVALSSCSSNRLVHLDAHEFQQQAERMEQPNSLLQFNYIGTSINRVYLEQVDSLTIRAKPTTTVFWTELNSLPEDTRAQLKAGKPPWRPWNQQSEQGH